VSHAWLDNAAAKWQALERWAKAFQQERGRPPTLWVDVVSIDQSAVAESLACLPIFLAGCESLLVLGGPVYTSRLWCIMEIFTFLSITTDLSRVTIVPLKGRGGRRSAAELDTLSAFSRFSVEQATCTLDTDRENILSVIQSSYGTYDDFDRAVRGLFAERLDPNAVPSRSASSYRAPSGADASRRTASELGWPMV